MPLPESVIIFGKSYPVVIESLEKDTDGLYDNGKISINLAVEEKDQEHVLWHEMGHAMMERTGITQSGISEELQEIIVENYATMIMEAKHGT